MKALILKASDSDYKKLKEINTLDDILKINNSIIIEYDEQTLDIYRVNKEYKDIKLVITIYDWWVE